jgi:hypothetical protein
MLESPGEGWSPVFPAAYRTMFVRDRMATTPLVSVASNKANDGLDPGRRLATTDGTGGGNCSTWRLMRSLARSARSAASLRFRRRIRSTPAKMAVRGALTTRTTGHTFGRPTYPPATAKVKANVPAKTAASVRLLTSSPEGRITHPLARPSPDGLLLPSLDRHASRLRAGGDNTGVKRLRTHRREKLPSGSPIGLTLSADGPDAG